MKRILVFAIFCLFAVSLHAQVSDASVCDILKNPESFNGKIVRVKGTVSAGFNQFVLKAPDCGQKVNAIWLSYPEGSKAKAGPAAILQLQPARNFAAPANAIQRTPVTLERNKDFKQFDSLLSTPYKSGGMCLGCVRYDVAATLVGRLDGAKAGITRNDAGKIVGISGFGNLNAYGARLVIQSVSEITPHEIDYSKTNAITKGDAFQESGGDPVAAARHAALAFGPNSAPGAKIARAADAWGKEGDHNGVEVTSGGQNEESSKAEGKSTQDSPDGVLFNCAFDPSRNKGDSLSRAMVHLGELIADLRNPASGQENASVYDLESFAWVTTALNAVASGQKTLTLPGGYLLWNAGWAPADRDKNLNDAVNGFLGTEELISR